MRCGPSFGAARGVVSHLQPPVSCYVGAGFGSEWNTPPAGCRLTRLGAHHWGAGQAPVEPCRTPQVIDRVLLTGYAQNYW